MMVLHLTNIFKKLVLDRDIPSPYLFILVMHVLFEDAKNDLNLVVPHRRGMRGVGQVEHPKHCKMQNANFNNLLYADDTICCTVGAESMQYLLRSIEKVGRRYGLALNKDKHVLISYNSKKQVKFTDGTPVRQVEEAKYLGCSLNADTDMNREISKRLQKCNTVLQKYTFLASWQMFTAFSNTSI